MDLTENSNLIRNVYITFQNRLTSDVSVTKALHVINPRLLMMWDRDIRAIYHKSHDNDHIEGKEECYLKFLKKCVGIIKVLVDTAKRDIIVSEEPTYKKYGFRETLTKIVDECNYVFAHPEKIRNGSNSQSPSVPLGKTR